jgi:zinc/manganese transport system substrate-binding protein
MTQKTFVTLLSAGLAGLCLGTARADLKVVATVPDLAAIAKEVGGAHVSVKAISLPTQDPHFVDARPSLVLDLNKADLLLSIGLQMEIGWLPVLVNSARNAAIQLGSPGYLECAQFVRLLEVPKQSIDRSMGDIHAGGNPHYLYDPRAAAAVAKGIGAKMAELDPQHRETYVANAAGFVRRLETARMGWERRMAPYRGSAIIAYHRTLVYLTDWLGLSEVEFLEPKPGIPPNPSHVAKVVAAGRARNVRVIVHESYYPTGTSAFVAEKLQATLVTFPGGTELQKGQSYIDHVGANLEQLARAFERGKGK